LKDYNVGQIAVYDPQYLSGLVPGAQLVYGDRDKNIRIPVTIVAEKPRVQPIPLSQPDQDAANVAWISKEDFYPGFATRWVLNFSIPKQFSEQPLYVYRDKDVQRVLDMDDPAVANRSELDRTRGIYVGEEAHTGGVTLNCTEDGCVSAAK
jgi:hypothetical protein